MSYYASSYSKMCRHRYLPVIYTRSSRSRYACVPPAPLRACSFASSTSSSSWQTVGDEAVQKWREELLRVEGALHKALYSTTGNSITNKQNGGKGVKDPSAFHCPAWTREVQSVVLHYQKVMSHLTRQHHSQETNESQRRITGALLAKRPFTSETLMRLDATQRQFLKSHCLKFYALQQMEASPEGYAVGFDDKAFTTLRQKKQEWQADVLKTTRFGRSGKASKVKKDLPKIARMDASRRAVLSKATQAHNQELMKYLWRVISWKDIKGCNAVKTSWNKVTYFEQSKTFQRREIAQLRDRVLHKMLETAVHPICEYQACSGSFAWRPGQRSAKQAAASLANLLATNYSNHPSIIQVDLEDCFDTIDHGAIQNSYPLSVQYQPFLQGFLKAPRRGHRTPRTQYPHYFIPLSAAERRRLQRNYPDWNREGPESHWRPNAGVLFDSDLGKSIVNNALDGLEATLRHGFIESSPSQAVNSNTAPIIGDDVQELVS